MSLFKKVTQSLLRPESSKRIVKQQRKKSFNGCNLTFFDIIKYVTPWGEAKKKKAP